MSLDDFAYSVKYAINLTETQKFAYTKSMDGAVVINYLFCNTEGLLIKHII